ncbi:hypothetical protein D3C72_1451650 [compost metagenome]
MPAAHAVRAVERVHDPARQRIAEHARDGDARHEQRDHLAAAVGREPVGQVQDHAGIETRFGEAEQEAHHVELGRRLHEHEQRRDDAPGDHDPRDPDARADLVHQQVARHLEQEVADEEQPCAQAEHGFGEGQVLAHLQLGEADIDAVQVGDHVAQHQERHDAPEHLAVGAFFDLGFGIQPGVAAQAVKGGHACRRLVWIHGGLRVWWWV